MIVAPSSEKVKVRKHRARVVKNSGERGTTPLHARTIPLKE
jgi:hypothetical protein